MTKISTAKEKYIEAVGRRKTAVARVRISNSKKGQADPSIIVNGKKHDVYFPLMQLQKKIVSPLEKSDSLKTFEISVHVNGGGISSQAEAIRHGLARALITHAPELRKKLKKFGFLTRDPRVVERKKYGLKKARKSPQWSKR